MPFLFLLFSLCFAEPAKKLSETGLYQAIQNKTIALKNRPFSPQYPLWTDGASKRRWIFLPTDKKIDSENPDQWRFPVGTKIWKEFSFHSKRVETRLIEKISDDDWSFASYLWNENETEALLAPEDGVPDYFPIQNGIKHDIPSVTECLRCHRKTGDPVMGFDAIQLSADRDPNAPHLEKLQPEMLTLKKLIEENLLSHASSSFKEGSPKILSESPEGRASLGYFHSNCATCHNPQGSAKHFSLNLAHLLSAPSEKETPAFKTTVNRRTQAFGIPELPETFRIKPQKPEESAIVYQMENTGASHMPPLGAKLIDTEAISLLKTWIQKIH